MTRFPQWVRCALVAALASLAPSVVHAQAGATATQQLALSVFGAGTGTATGLGKNLAITAGGDLAFMSFRRYRPVLEVRGSYPVDSGRVAGEKDVLAGLRVERQFNNLHPYIDFLVGRGEINYNRIQVGDFIYLKSTTMVYSPGLGVELDVTPHWAAKADLQLQRWDTPIRPSGHTYSKSLSLGVVYRFDFNPGHRHFR